MSRTPITTHILDLDTGRPAEGVAVSLFGPPSEAAIAQARTDSDGRIGQWDNEFTLSAGEYCLVFAVEDWFRARERTSFYRDIRIAFQVEQTREHYHVPLLLNAHGYSTYRGS